MRWWWGSREQKRRRGGRGKGVTVVSMVKQWSSWLPTEPGSAAAGMCMLFALTHIHAHTQVIIFSSSVVCVCACV